MKLTHAQPLEPGPDEGQLETLPLLDPISAEVEARALAPSLESYSLFAFDDLPLGFLGWPMECSRSANELGLYTHWAHIERAEPDLYRDYLVRICEFDQCIETMGVTDPEELCPVYGRDCPAGAFHADVCREAGMIPEDNP